MQKDVEIFLQFKDSQSNGEINMTLIDTTVEEKDKDISPCPRIGCKNKGIYPLPIILIDRLVFFCAKHKEEMEVCGLVSSVIDTNNNGE